MELHSKVTIGISTVPERTLVGSENGIQVLRGARLRDFSLMPSYSPSLACAPGSSIHLPISHFTLLHPRLDHRCYLFLKEATKGRNPALQKGEKYMRANAALVGKCEGQDNS